MKSFSERKGLKQVRDIIPAEEMPTELRNSLWNGLAVIVWDSPGFIHSRGSLPGIDSFSEVLWMLFFKKPIDERPSHQYLDRSSRILKLIREYFFNCSWNEVYDLLEFTVKSLKNSKPHLAEFLNVILTRELAAYRFVEGMLVEITNEQERMMLNDALADTKFSGVSGHLNSALALLADRKQPNYRNSIKESISAVEAMARILSGNEKATLGDALKILEKSRQLHPALKDAFSKLYGYTNDESGIRHAMLDVPDLSQADAKYFLLICTSFVNYLKSKLN